MTTEVNQPDSEWETLDRNVHALHKGVTRLRVNWPDNHYWHGKIAVFDKITNSHFIRIVSAEGRMDSNWPEENLQIAVPRKYPLPIYE